MVLSRHRDEGITLELTDGSRVHIVIVDIRGDKCRVGIDAAPDITIHRDEIFEQVDEQRRAAARAEASGQTPARRPVDPPMRVQVGGANDNGGIKSGSNNAPSAHDMPGQWPEYGDRPPQQPRRQYLQQLGRPNQSQGSPPGRRPPLGGQNNDRR